MTDSGNVVQDFLAVSREIIWSTITTVGANGAPRSRVVHPIFTIQNDRPVGWIVTGRTPVKTAHLAANPRVALSWWSPAQDVAYAD